MKTCRRCGETKPESDFYRYTDRSGQQRPMARCKACHTVAVQASARRNPGARRRADVAYAARRRHTRRLTRYGLTAVEFAAMEAAQQGRCLLCGDYKGEALVVDHDHSTGETRGLLCQSCNHGLGNFRDDPVRLARAINYLRAGALWPSTH